MNIPFLSSYLQNNTGSLSRNFFTKLRIYCFIIAILFISAKTVYAFEYSADLSLSLSEEYDDNVFLNSSNEKNDFITYVSPGLNFNISSRHSRLSLGYLPTFSYYSSHDDLNETTHRVTGDFNLELSQRLTFNMTSSFIKSSETRDFIDTQDIGPITRRDERQYYTINGDLSYRFHF